MTKHNKFAAMEPSPRIEQHYEIPLLLLHGIAGLLMTGIIWFVQIVHYPLFSEVGASGFTDYEKLHTFRTAIIVMPPMCIELITAILLITFLKGKIPMGTRIGIAGMTWIIWALTFFIHVPQHEVLSEGFDPAVYQSLVSTNWFRTSLWTLKSALSIWATVVVLSDPIARRSPPLESEPVQTTMEMQ